MSDPVTGKDIVTLGWVANVKIQQGRVTFDVHVAYQSHGHIDLIRAESTRSVKAL
ncbi:MAG: DUF59 domain-containing protein, partial [Bdellovibrionales bacterium]|nr:DUF59 domain-containing protein [Bdellovibrionales bacterium]